MNNRLQDKLMGLWFIGILVGLLVIMIGGMAIVGDADADTINDDVLYLGNSARAANKRFVFRNITPLEFFANNSFPTTMSLTASIFQMGDGDTSGDQSLNFNIGGLQSTLPKLTYSPSISSFKLENKNNLLLGDNADSTSLKAFLFDAFPTLASNPGTEYDEVNAAIRIKNVNKVLIGDGNPAANNIELIWDVGQSVSYPNSGTYPRIRHNATTGKLQATDDGVTYRNLTEDNTGGGGGSQAQWLVDVNIVASTSTRPLLSLVNVSNYSFVTDSTLSLTNNTAKGSEAGVEIACAGTTASSGTTCTGEAEVVGFAFNLPANVSLPVTVDAYCDFTHWMYLENRNGSFQTTFQLVETDNNAQTIIQEGGSRAGNELGGPLTNHTLAKYTHVPGTFVFSTSGKKTIKLFYEMETTVTVDGHRILADGDANNGQRDIHCRVMPIK